MTGERPDFFSLGEEEQRRVTKTFTHARYPGLSVTVQLAEPDANTRYLAAQLSGLLIRRYITGDASIGAPAFPFEVNGKPRQLTTQLCDDVGLIAAMEPDPWDLDTPRFEPEELLQMAFKRRLIWDQVRLFAQELFYDAESALPNASAEPGGS